MPEAESVGSVKSSDEHVDVSENRGTHHGCLIGFSIINHPFWGSLFMETPMYPRIMSPNWGGLKLVELTACCGALCTPSALYPLLFCKDDVKVLPMFCTNFHILGSGCKYVLFLSLLGEMIQFDLYFADGLKPPTSISLSGALLHPLT